MRKVDQLQAQISQSKLNSFPCGILIIHCIIISHLVFADLLKHTLFAVDESFFVAFIQKSKSIKLASFQCKLEIIRNTIIILPASQNAIHPVDSLKNARVSWSSQRSCQYFILYHLWREKITRNIYWLRKLKKKVKNRYLVKEIHNLWMALRR